jgi:RNA polymerase sigma-70 factor (ECF subfamily)
MDPRAYEAHLVSRASTGDHEAFHELHRRFAPLVHGIILARVPRDEADDLAQDVFMNAYEKLGTLRDPYAFGPWLAVMARNSANGYYRKPRAMEELPEELPGGQAVETNAHEVFEAIRGLSETYRETLILRLVEGMTGPEIAEKTGLTPDSVRVNLHRGMKMLRERLGIGA